MKKIIIIEDDTLLNKTLAYNLVSDGYEVVSAYSYSMAVSLLKEDYHLALLDINLPDGNGLDFCSKLKEKYPECYIIFLTANDKESDMLKGYEVGGADYITKPFSDPLFIFAFDWGIRGAAIATAVSQCAGCAILFLFFLRKNTIIRISIKNFSLDFSLDRKSVV